jgi:hypothetical protein
MSAVALAPWGAAWAQTLNGGMNELEDAYRKRRILAGQLLKGTTAFDAGDKTHDEALDLEARYMTYRVYLDRLEVREEKANRPTIERAFRDFEGDLNYLEKGKPGTQAASDVFRDKLRLHALEVIQFEKAKPIHKLFNARILAEVGKLGQAQLADTLVEVLADKTQTDGVRFYALRGLRTLLALPGPMPMQPLLNKAQETKCAEALLDFLEKKQGPSKGAPKDEIDGFRVLRREASGRWPSCTRRRWARRPGPPWYWRVSPAPTSASSRRRALTNAWRRPSDWPACSRRRTNSISPTTQRTRSAVAWARSVRHSATRKPTARKESIRSGHGKSTPTTSTRR